MKEAERLLKHLGIEYTRLTVGQINDHKRAWIHRLVAPERQREAKECGCLPMRSHSGYLWHAFSFKLLDGLCDDEARRAFQTVKRGEAILLANWDNAGYHIPDASALMASTLDEMADVVLTSTDFKWTYAKTHESDLGPYFFRKRQR